MADLTVVTTGTDVDRGTDFQNKINAAALGDRILLTAGFTYQGNFLFPNKGAGTNYITVQLLDAQMSTFPAGTRVSRTQVGSMAKLVTNNQQGTLTFDINSHHWKIIGCELTATAVPYTIAQSYAIVRDNNDPGAAYGQWPKNITIDRCVIHPYLSDSTSPLGLGPFREFSKGVAIDGSDITVTECDIYDFGVWDIPSNGLAGNGISITAATNASPCQITTSSAPDGVQSGRKFWITFYKTTGTGAWNALNGTHMATWIDNTHFTLENFDINLNLTPLNSTSFGSYPGGYNQITTFPASLSHAILIIGGPGPYVIHNNFLEAYYCPIFTGGGSGTWIDPAHQKTVVSANSLTQVTLNSAPADLQVGDLIAFGDTQDQTITGAVAGNPTTLNVQTMGFPTGTYLFPEGYITVSGFTGAWAACNGNWGGGGNAVNSNGGTVVTTGANSLTIPVDSTGFGAVTSSSPKWAQTTKFTFSGSHSWCVGKVTGISGAVVDYQWWGHQPQNTNGNGAGILIKANSPVEYRGRNIDDLTITNNTLSNRTFWFKLVYHNCNLNEAVGQTAKGMWESKMATNVLVEGNIFQLDQGSCAPFVDYVALALNQANQIGRTPWISNSYWTVRNNWFKTNALQKIGMHEEYETGTTGTDFTFTNNLVGRSQSSFVTPEGTKNITVTHNTVRNLGSNLNGIYGFMNVVHDNDTVVIKDNLGNWCSYGYIVQGPDGTMTNLTRNHNIYIDNFNVDFTPPTGDLTRVETDTDMKFTDYVAADAGGDRHGYKLLATSPGYHAASDGKDVGVDFDLLDAALGGTPAAPATGYILFRHRKP